MKTRARGRVLWAAAAGLATAGLAVLGASAQTPFGPELPRALRLEVVRASGAERCPSPAFFHERVLSELDRESGDPFSESAAARLVVTIEPGPKGYRGRWEAYDAQGALVQRFEDDPTWDCFHLADSMAFAFVYRWETGPARPAPAATASPTAAPATPPPSAQASSSPPAAAPRVWKPPRLPKPLPPPCKGDDCDPVDVSIFFQAGVLMTAGWAADVSPGAMLAAGIQPSKWFSFALEARLLFPARVVAKEAVDPSKPVIEHDLDVSHLSLGAVPCFHYSFFFGCGVAQVGFNIHRSDRAETYDAHYAFGPRLGLRFPLGDRFAIQAFGDALFDPAPSAVGFRDLNSNWRQSIVSGFFGAAFTVNLQ